MQGRTYTKDNRNINRLFPGMTEKGRMVFQLIQRIHFGSALLKKDCC